MLHNLSELSYNEIYLRPSNPTDINLYVRCQHDGDCARYTNHDLLLESNKSVLHLLEESENITHFDSTVKLFTICKKSNSEGIGFIGLWDTNFQTRSAEIGVWIHSDYTNQGSGADALMSILRYGFNYLNLHKIYLEVECENTRAVELYTKIGFEEEGLFKDANFREGKYHDKYRMALFNKKFQQKYE